MSLQGQELWSAVDAYLSDTVVPPDPMMDAALAASQAAGLPAINIEANQGRFLELLVRMCGAKRVLELGTLGGYSTIWMARGLPQDGSLLTLELEERCAAVAEANFVAAGMESRITLRLGPALDSLAALTAEGVAPFDFVFFDADKLNYPNYLEAVLPLTRPGTVLVADNVVRAGRVLNADSNEPNIVGTRRFNQLLGSHPRLSATVLQVVGSKGHDGLAFAIVDATAR